jgi:hypothetical protein
MAPFRVRVMKHVTYAEKSLLIGDTAADLLLTYAAALGSTDRSDTVTLHAISGDGDEVDATFLVGEGAPLMAETTTNTLREPDNAVIEADLQHKIDALTQPAHGGPLTDTDQFPDDYTAAQH